MGTVTIINTEPYKLQPVPEVGKEYHIFDDGKIRLSRHDIVRIIDVIPFEDEDLGTDLLDKWSAEKEECDWLYAQETDYFVRAKCGKDTDHMYFVRTVDSGWFSLGFWASRLDTDGSLYEKMKESYGEE